MGLEEIYSSQISRRGQIRHTSVGGSMPVATERDPNLIKLESDIFSRMNQVAQAMAPKIPLPVQESQIAVKHVSVEDAILELIALQGMQ